MTIKVIGLAKRAISHKIYDIYYTYIFYFCSTVAEEGTPRHAPSIQRIRAIFGDKGEGGSESPNHQISIQTDSMKEGWLHCKVAAVDGKVS